MFIDNDARTRLSSFCRSLNFDEGSIEQHLPELRNVLGDDIDNGCVGGPLFGESHTPAVIRKLEKMDGYDPKAKTERAYNTMRAGKWGVLHPDGTFIAEDNKSTTTNEQSETLLSGEVLISDLTNQT